MSEDLPHVSGIKTHIFLEKGNGFKSEDLPHVSGIKTRIDGSFGLPAIRRKTCPTNRGLRHNKTNMTAALARSEDLPHTSGVSSFSDDLKPRSSENVGKPAPLIGD